MLSTSFIMNFSCAGEQPNDLQFSCGQVLTILEPCSVKYWYLAEDKMGKRGVVPITYLQVNEVLVFLLATGKEQV